MIEKLKNFWNKGAWQKALIIFVVLMVIGMFAPADEEESTANEPNTEEKATKTVEQKEEKPKLIEVGKDKKFKVKGFELYSDLPISQDTIEFNNRGWGGDEKTFYKAEGEYVTVNIFAKNITKKSKENDISMEDVKLLVDGSEYDYSEDLETEYRTDNRKFSSAKKVNPGMQQLQRYTFDIPKGLYDKNKVYLVFKIDDQKYKIRVK